MEPPSAHSMTMEKPGLWESFSTSLRIFKDFFVFNYLFGLLLYRENLLYKIFSDLFSSQVGPFILLMNIFILQSLKSMFFQFGGPKPEKSSNYCLNFFQALIKIKRVVFSHNRYLKILQCFASHKCEILLANSPYDLRISSVYFLGFRLGLNCWYFFLSRLFLLFRWKIGVFKP